MVFMKIDDFKFDSLIMSKVGAEELALITVL